MILKSYETKKIDINKNNIILFYGQNEGGKKEEISKIISLNDDKSLFAYDEKEILEKIEIFYSNIFSFKSSLNCSRTSIKDFPYFLTDMP